MFLTTDLNPTTAFARIPNSATLDENLTAHEYQLWCRLFALQGARRKEPLKSIGELAEAIGLSVDLLRKRKSALRRKGYIQEDRRQICITIPAEGFVPKELSIADEEAEKPKRKSTGLSPADRKTLIKEAWNKYKPDWCAPISGNIPPPLYFAIEAQTKHLEHDRDDYDGFMRLICAAISVNPFWRDRASKPVKAHGIFGWGTPDDKKFRNCETLYAASKSGQAKAASWDVSSDEDWIAWFHQKGRTSYTKVERFIVESRLEALKLESDKPLSSDTIRIYQRNTGFPELWTEDSESAFVRAQLPSNG